MQGGRGKAWRRGMIGGIDPAKRRGSFGRGGAAGSRPTLGGARGARPTWRPPPRFSRDATEAPLARAARPQQRREATQLGRGGADVRRNSNIGAGELTGIGGGRWQQHRQLVVKGMELWAKLCRKRVDHHKPAIKWRGCSATRCRRGLRRGVAVPHTCLRRRGPTTLLPSATGPRRATPSPVHNSKRELTRIEGKRLDSSCHTSETARLPSVDWKRRAVATSAHCSEPIAKTCSLWACRVSQRGRVRVYTLLSVRAHLRRKLQCRPQCRYLCERAAE